MLNNVPSLSNNQFQRISYRFYCFNHAFLTIATFLMRHINFWKKILTSDVIKWRASVKKAHTIHSYILGIEQPISDKLLYCPFVRLNSSILILCIFVKRRIVSFKI